MSFSISIPKLSLEKLAIKVMPKGEDFKMAKTQVEIFMTLKIKMIMTIKLKKD